MTTAVNLKELRRNLQLRINKKEHTIVKERNESTYINNDTQMRTTTLPTGVQAIQVSNDALHKSLRTRVLQSEHSCLWQI